MGFQIPRQILRTIAGSLSYKDGGNYSVKIPMEQLPAGATKTYSNVTARPVAPIPMALDTAIPHGSDGSFGGVVCSKVSKA
jgi:hypothetical protein